MTEVAEDAVAVKHQAIDAGHLGKKVEEENDEELESVVHVKDQGRDVPRL